MWLAALLCVFTQLDNPTITLFVFHGNINKILGDGEVGTIKAEIIDQTDGVWSFEDKNVTLKAGDVLNYNVLVVRNQQMFSVNGSFHVKGASAGGDNAEDVTETFFPANITMSPDIVVQPTFDNTTKREFTAAVGQPAYLPCKVKNLGDRSVSWIRKRDLHILTVGVHTYSSDARFAALHVDNSDEWILRVAHAQPRDSGAYECQVSTEPKISLSFRLTVVVSKAEILSGPELFVRAGSDINLTCIARHAPDPPSFIYWYRGANVVNYAQRGGISVETEQRTRTSRLLIARASPRDSGNYTCAPSSSDSASVVVHVVSGERPAAMQSDANRSFPIMLPILLILIILNHSRYLLDGVIRNIVQHLNFLWPYFMGAFIVR